MLHFCRLFLEGEITMKNKNRETFQFFNQYFILTHKEEKLKNKEKYKIRRNILNSVQGLPYNFKIQALWKIAMESRLQKETYEKNLNHSLLYDITNFLSLSLFSFFATIIGSILGFMGSITTNILQKGGENKTFGEYLILIRESVPLILKNGFLSCYVLVIGFVILIVLISLYIYAHCYKNHYKYLIYMYSYQENYSLYLINKLINL
jgi:hypothetical protein